MKYKILIGAVFAALFGVNIAAQPASATDDPLVQPRTSVDDSSKEDARPLRATFIEEDPEEDLSSLVFGRNLLLAGNSFDNDSDTSGLLFSFGNIMKLQTSSEYAFIAGNSITIDGKVEKDAFIAGNIITIDKSAEIGRDVFIAGNEIRVQTNIPGDFSAGASKVIFEDVTIDGNVNLDVAGVEFRGTVNIKGKLILNADADLRGSDNLTYTEIERYENYKPEVTVSDIMISVTLGIICLFIAFVILLAIFPGINKKVERELSSLQFGKDLVIGICALFLIPICCIFLFISIIGSAAGIALLLGYILMLFFAQAFAGFWLGKLIMEKAFHTQMNPFLEALIGIIIVRVCAMIPYLGFYVSMIAVVLGLGLIMQSIRTRGKKNNNQGAIEEAEVTEEETVVTEPKSSSKKTVKKSDHSTDELVEDSQEEE